MGESSEWVAEIVVAAQLSDPQVNLLARRLILRVGVIEMTMLAAIEMR
jgi:hypothetical protein